LKQAADSPACEIEKDISTPPNPLFDPRPEDIEVEQVENEVRGVGVKWVRSVTNTYSLSQMRDTLREALTSKDKGPKVVIAQSECMLTKQRRVRPLFNKAVKEGKRMVRTRFGVDSDTGVLEAATSLAIGEAGLPPNLTSSPLVDPLRRLYKLSIALYRTGSGGPAL